MPNSGCRVEAWAGLSILAYVSLWDENPWVVREEHTYTIYSRFGLVLVWTFPDGVLLDANFGFTHAHTETFKIYHYVCLKSKWNLSPVLDRCWFRKLLLLWCRFSLSGVLRRFSFSPQCVVAALFIATLTKLFSRLFVSLLDSALGQTAESGL